MTRWVRIAATADCPPGEARELVAEGRIIALFNVDGAFYAMDGVCPHQGGPLGKGELHGCILTCPWHGWQYDVRSGQHQANPSLQHACYPVKTDGDDLFVELDAHVDD